MGEVFARRYELLEPIAEGGMGAVWLVHDHQDGDVKAAKLLRQSDAGTLLRFMREQSTRIHHPHVVTPLSWVGEDDTVLFTMPLVRGGSVATLIGDLGPLPETWVATILDQTLDALDAVHAAGVVHRDVKPANVLLEPTGQGSPHVRLTDFGIAAMIDQPRLTSASTAIGTPGYMAPEQLQQSDPHPRQDLYGVATVGLEMLLGHPPPFDEADLPTTRLGRLLQGARDPDPGQRPESAAAMRAALRDSLPGSWHPGDVEVLDHFADPASPLPQLRQDPVTVVLDPGPPEETAPPPEHPEATDPPPEPAIPWSERLESWGPLAPAGLVVLGVALLAVSAWLLLG